LKKLIVFSFRDESKLNSKVYISSGRLIATPTTNYNLIFYHLCIPQLLAYMFIEQSVIIHEIAYFNWTVYLQCYRDKKWISGRGFHMSPFVTVTSLEI